MANNFDDTYSANLIGLWDFIRCFESKDTGLDDGFAQNGLFKNGAYASGDQLRLDGHNDRFTVGGVDSPFQLSQGTIIVEFTEKAQVSNNDDTLVSRGEYMDRHTEGFLDIHVTQKGAVEVVHFSDGNSICITTSERFFQLKDVVKVAYSWSETDGGALLVQNLTTGFEERIEIDTNLSLDIGDRDCESFTFGARERDDGVFDQHFKGAIDYVAVYDADVISDPPTELDGIVEGTDGNDLIDLAYTGDPEGDRIDAGDAILPGAEPDDDVVEAGAGDDTIRSGLGNDTIYAGTGDDTVFGEDGDDTIYGGDGSDSVSGGAGNDIIITSSVEELPDLGFPSYMGFPAIPVDPDPFNDRDVVDGGDGDDIIFTGDDEDIVFGGAGNDKIYGGLDRDVLDGGTGNDFIVGGEGSDTITGGDGDDIIYGGLDPIFPDRLNIPDDGSVGDPDPETDNGRDVIDGGAGNDIIFGQDDQDRILGGTGDDFIDGGVDNDTLLGEDGNDTLLGGQGADTIVGGAGNDLIDGGIDADNMAGGDDRDTFIGITQGDRVDGGEGFTSDPGDDFDTLDLTGAAEAANPGGSLSIAYTTPDRENGVVTFRDSGGTVTGTVDFFNIENVVPCFTPGTLIATPKGQRPVERLDVGDRVITRDNGIQEIRWIGQRDLKRTELQDAVHLKPILIRAGALGGDLPEQDMLVSPNHRVLVTNDKTALYFEESEVLVAAKHLIALEGVDVVQRPGISYIHFLFDQHEVVLSDGIWTESFQPGTQTLAGLGNSQRIELFELFPGLKNPEGVEGYQSARRSLKKYEARVLFP